MFTTFLMAVVLFIMIAVAGSAVGIYLFAEAKWNKHRLSRCSCDGVARFSASY